ncbi:hypothetical protein SUGI_0921770 [Cryptomeria japonica]|nr:hypothetical protein SUGI_0921770 [Cryptomeria japonica]
MAPECGCGVKSSPKQYVFSFGVVLLELVTGKATIIDEEGERSLAKWAAITRKKDGHVVLGLVDRELVNDGAMKLRKWLRFPFSTLDYRQERDHRCKE